MISHSYPNPKNKHNRYPNPPTNSTYQPPQSSSPISIGHGYVRDMSKVKDRASRVNIPIQEWIRRDNIVMQKAKDCPFSVGDTFYPTSLEWYGSHGKCVVEGKIVSYVEIDLTDTWPDDDDPYIISARSLTKETKFICSPNFMTRKEPINT